MLRQAGHWQDAVHFLAAALPRREAVWWACQCARAALGAELEPDALTALQAAETWAADATDDHRRACLPLAEAVGAGTVPGCPALAAYFSEGSLGPAGAPPVPPKEGLAASIVGNGIILAAVFPRPIQAEENYRRFLALGVEVGDGVNSWPQSAPPPPKPVAPPAVGRPPASPVPPGRPAPPTAPPRWKPPPTRR